MSGFEFIFSLFGLMLGLALAEGLGGLARALKASHHVRIGWPTALLGLFVTCDVVTFWMYGWAMRELIPVTWPVMFGGFLVTAVLFVAASLIFPNEPEEWADLDAHFEKHRRTVLGGLLFANVALLATTVALIGLAPVISLKALVATWSFFPVCLLAIVTSNRRAVIACLIWLIALYPISALWQ
jgi:hypothetical protein